MMTKKIFYVEFWDCMLCDPCPVESMLHLFLWVQF
jgi:hypothetical protein